MATRIVLADDHKIIRDGLRSLLDQQSDIEVVSEVGDGRTAIERVRTLAPDVVVKYAIRTGLTSLES